MIGFYKRIMHNLSKTPSYISKQVEMSRLFFMETGETEGFGVPCGGYERCQADYRIDRRGMPWYGLEFVNRGQGSLVLGGVSHALRPGAFYIYDPEMSHRIESSAENPLGKYFVCFHGPEVADFLAAYGLVPGTVSHCHKGESVRRCFDMLIERGLRKSRLAKPLCTLIVKELLLMCSDDSTGAVDIGSPAYATYSRALEFIKENYLNLNSLDAVAKGCEVEAAYLCRLFARYHDESPYQFLTRLRMDHASRLLLMEGASVRSVAKELDYKDPFHFSRVFKSVHRVPPSRYRHSIHS